jgi:hypothetical protein
LIILVTGGRDYADEDHVLATFKAFIREHGKPDLLIVGDATGADSLARVVAYELDIPVEVHYADWSLWGKRAGIIRNAEMVARGPDFLLHFPGNKGTADCIMRCVRKKIPLYRLRKDDE